MSNANQIMGGWDMGRSEPVRMELHEAVDRRDYAVTFYVSMRQVFESRRFEIEKELLIQATRGLGDAVKAHLSSPEFRDEVKRIAAAELKPLLKQALIDRLDEIMEDVLA